MSITKIDDPERATKSEVLVPREDLAARLFSIVMTGVVAVIGLTIVLGGR